MRAVFTPWLTVRVDHGYYRSGRCDDLRFVPSPSTAQLLARRALLFRERAAGFAVVKRDDASLDEGDVLRFLAFLRSSELVSVSDLPNDPRPYKLKNRTGHSRLTAGAVVAAADLASAVHPEVRDAGAFASVELVTPAGGWPAGTTGFTAAFQPRSAKWRYHVVLKAGDTATYTIDYGTAAGPYPAGVTFGADAAPAALQASYPGRTIASFVSSDPLPFFETPLVKNALKRNGNLVFESLPNPSRQSPGSTDVLVELR